MAPALGRAVGVGADGRAIGKEGSGLVGRSMAAVAMMVMVRRHLVAAPGSSDLFAKGNVGCIVSQRTGMVS
jgi:hypothetical protein